MTKQPPPKGHFSCVMSAEVVERFRSMADRDGLKLHRLAEALLTEAMDAREARARRKGAA